MTGVTGPTGPTVTANNIQVVNGTPQTKTPGQLLNLGPSPNIQNGSAITYNGSDTITLAPNQIYQACYSVTAVTNSTGQVFVGLAGVGGSGSSANGLVPGTILTLSNCSLVNSNVNPTLSLRYGAAAGGATSFNSVEINVVKLQ
ncbi:hypothetical protein ACE41H_24245 [Paenibacillus enshidis]|uniref:Uncharacterized protein n=1 Tax=Paenibacillus enshidis TaxID=1458439 RepID=A0ABV5B076_9BACL